jgi:hypothetical protein
MTAVLIDAHVHEKVFNDRIAELLALFVIKESALYFIFVFDCSINSNGYGSFSHRHLPHISFYFYQRGTGPKYGSGVPCKRYLFLSEPENVFKTNKNILKYPHSVTKLYDTSVLSQ